MGGDRHNDKIAGSTADTRQEGSSSTATTASQHQQQLQQPEDGGGLVSLLSAGNEEGQGHQQSMTMITQYVSMGVGIIVILVVFFPGLFRLLLLLVLAVGLLLGFLHRDCPSDESFDSKRQLKRVLRGHHLADDDPRKPKGFWKQNLARLGASLATELPNAIGQHQVTIHPIGTIAKVARIRVQTANQEYTWIGLAGRWVYFQASDIAEESCELTERGVGVVT